MTISDGNYSISATLNPDLKHSVESGVLGKNTVFEINGYTIHQNVDETYAGRMLRLDVGAITVVFSKFPDSIGDPQDIFDAMKNGPIQYISVPKHPALMLTPRALDALACAKPMQIFKSGNPFNLEVTQLSKLNAEVWFVVLFDGWTHQMAVLWKMLDLERMGIKDHLANNLSAVMTYDGNGLKKGDIIEITQFCMLGEDDAMIMGLWNVRIIYHA
jgi:hypothetical protein